MSICQCKQSDGETCHKASVLMKNGRNLTKGKKNQFTVSKIGQTSTWGPKESTCPSKIGVSHDTSTQAQTGCQVDNDIVNTFISSTTVVDLHDSDKYKLEIQTKL